MYQDTYHLSDIDYLKALPLTQALWWFIENVPENSAGPCENGIATKYNQIPER